MEQAAECCRLILHHVNQAVRDTEDLLVSRYGSCQGGVGGGLGPSLPYPQPRQSPQLPSGSPSIPGSSNPPHLPQRSLSVQVSPGAQQLPIKVTGGQAWPQLVPQKLTLALGFPSLGSMRVGPSACSCPLHSRLCPSGSGIISGAWTCPT